MNLSPCKHCGSPAHLTKSVTDPHMCWSVACSNLDCGIATRAFSQQQHAVDAWQRCAGPAYSHRNGEAKAPTVVGKYWFSGNFAGHLMADVISVYSDGAVWYADAYDKTDNYDGQWWGPVLPPGERPR